MQLVMDFIFKVLKKVPGTSLWFMIVFLASGIIINILHVCTLPLWLINKSSYRWINNGLAYLHWCQLTFLCEWYCGVNIIFYGTEEDYRYLGYESALVLPNHRSDVDWLIGWSLSDRVGTLGATKCFMKSYLQFLPILGISWLSTEYAFVKRNWKNDRKVLEKSLQQYEDFPFPYWIGIFAEGTRVTDAKLKASKEHAISTGLPVLHHHLLPRPRGFAISAHLLKDKVGAVYDMELGFPPDSEPTMRKLLMGEGFDAHLFVRRIPMSDVPTDSIEATSNWCRRQFQEKDKAFQYFVDHGEFPAPRRVYPRTMRNLIVVTIWHLLLIVTMASYIIAALLSGDINTLLIIGGLFLLGLLTVKLLLHITDSKKGSSFGLKKSQNGITESATKKEN